MKRIRIEFIIREQRPYQSEQVVTRNPAQLTIDEDQLVVELGKLLDRSAQAYQRDRDHLVLRWRRVRFLGGQWQVFR